MIKTLFISFLLLFGLGSLSAQTFIGKINPYPGPDKAAAFNKDTLKILAVMVNFQTDKYESTVGNGKFGSIYPKNYGQDIIDPLPHDRKYFEAHLEFVKNYFKKVSNNKLNIAYYVLPDTFSVSQQMQNYSPSSSADFTPLGNFAKEVWAIAGQMYPNFDFQDYDVFLIFHAGVGKDLTLPGSLGNEKDLPSVYLSDNALKKIYGQTFNGFPVSSGGFDITNSMIIPETESRVLSTVVGDTLIQISINGLLVSSIASYLGLPDLYNTSTGLTAIGRFGLMDGQAIFAYNGLFPPEPSAWEKIFLGWATPKVISLGNSHVDLAAELAANSSDTTILKVPINSSEYFLLENRQRDAHKDGAIITYVSDGDTLTKVFPKDTTGFYSYDTDSLRGVVINVDEFDWALPGSGILIWHIDDNIINQKIGEDAINADPKNRGVYIEEADGVQDIGYEYTDILGNTVIVEGDQTDLWYKNNPSRFFKDKFGPDTQPNSNSNDGANSLITISDFSSIANKMSFNVSMGDSLIKPVFKLQIPTNVSYSGLSAIAINDSFYLGLANNADLTLYDQKGSIVKQLSAFSDVKPASIFENDSLFIFGITDSTLNVYVETSNANTTFHFNIPASSSASIESSPVIVKNNGNLSVFVGSNNGNIYQYNNSLLNSTDKALPIFLNGADHPLFKLAAYGSYLSSVSSLTLITVSKSNFARGTADYNETFFKDNRGNSMFIGGAPVDFALTKSKDGTLTSIILTKGSNFYIIQNGSVVKKFNVGADSIKSFSLSDLKQDGDNYIMFCSNGKLYAVNLQGANADNFPVKDPENIGFEGTPLSVDFTGDSKPEVIVSTTDGRIFAFDGASGKVISGFPISTGNKISLVPAVSINDGNIDLSALTQNYNFYSWNIYSGSPILYWSEANGSSLNNSFLDKALSNNQITQFFPSGQAYNYPNPVYGNSTNIRYYVSEDSKINIKIFDLAGDLVAEMNDNAKGGFDNETVWNVSNVQSGVYLARIEATSNSGKTQSKIIKIAVIK